MQMRLAKNLVLFATVGLGLSLVIFGLASVAPSVFGWLTVPFWVLPAIANLGAHDVDWRLFLLSGTLSYGVVAFLIYRWRMRRIQS
jgi:hypothetical protein